MGRGHGNAARGEQRAVSSVGAGLELGREFFCQLMRHGGTQLRRLAADLGAWVGHPVPRLRHAREARATTGDSLDPARRGAAGVVRAGVSSEIITCHYHNYHRHHRHYRHYRSNLFACFRPLHTCSAVR